MSYYLWEMRPYFRQVAGQLMLGSISGIVMNTAVVLPAILLGRAIDTAMAFERGEADVVIAGGGDSTSNAEVKLPQKVVHAVAPLALGKKGKALKAGKPLPKE